MSTHASDEVPPLRRTPAGAKPRSFNTSKQERQPLGVISNRVDGGRRGGGRTSRSPSAGRSSTRSPSTTPQKRKTPDRRKDSSQMDTSQLMYVSSWAELDQILKGSDAHGGDVEQGGQADKDVQTTIGLLVKPEPDGNENTAGRVTGCIPGSPADICGELRADDLIISVDGVPFKHPDGLYRMRGGDSDSAMGTVVRLTVQRQDGAHLDCVLVRDGYESVQMTREILSAIDMLKAAAEAGSSAGAQGDEKLREHVLQAAEHVQRQVVQMGKVRLSSLRRLRGESDRMREVLGTLRRQIKQAMTDGQATLESLSGKLRSKKAEVEALVEEGRQREAQVEQLREDEDVLKRRVFELESRLHARPPSAEPRQDGEYSVEEGARLRAQLEAREVEMAEQRSFLLQQHAKLQADAAEHAAELQAELSKVREAAAAAEAKAERQAAEAEAEAARGKAALAAEAEAHAREVEELEREVEELGESMDAERRESGLATASIRREVCVGVIRRWLSSSLHRILAAWLAFAAAQRVRRACLASLARRQQRRRLAAWGARWRLAAEEQREAGARGEAAGARRARECARRHLAGWTRWRRRMAKILQRRLLALRGAVLRGWAAAVAEARAAAVAGGLEEAERAAAESEAAVERLCAAVEVSGRAARKEEERGRGGEVGRRGGQREREVQTEEAMERRGGRAGAGGGGGGGLGGEELGGSYVAALQGRLEEEVVEGRRLRGELEAARGRVRAQEMSLEGAGVAERGLRAGLEAARASLQRAVREGEEERRRAGLLAREVEEVERKYVALQVEREALRGRLAEHRREGRAGGGGGGSAEEREGGYGLLARSGGGWREGAGGRGGLGGEEGRWMEQAAAAFGRRGLARRWRGLGEVWGAWVGAHRREGAARRGVVRLMARRFAVAVGAHLEGWRGRVRQGKQLWQVSVVLQARHCRAALGAALGAWRREVGSGQQLAARAARAARAGERRAKARVLGALRLGALSALARAEVHCREEEVLRLKARLHASAAALHAAPRPRSALYAAALRSADALATELAAQVAALHDMVHAPHHSPASALPSPSPSLSPPAPAPAPALEEMAAYQFSQYNPRQGPAAEAPQGTHISSDINVSTSPDPRLLGSGTGSLSEARAGAGERGAVAVSGATAGSPRRSRRGEGRAGGGKPGRSAEGEADGARQSERAQRELEAGRERDRRRALAELQVGDDQPPTPSGYTTGPGLDGDRGPALEALQEVLTPHQFRRMDRPVRKPRTVDTLRV